MGFNEAVLWYVAFLFSTTFHEASHAFVALKLGDPTAYRGGQVTLDPIPHIQREPFGMVLIPILSFMTGGWLIGWASAPYDYEWARDYPKRSAMMSAAGPLANLVLALIAAILINIGLFLGFFYPIETGEMLRLSHLVQAFPGSAFVPFATFLSIFFSINIILFTFNLLPIPPLDGSGILPGFLSKENARKYMDTIHTNMLLLFFGILIVWNIFPFILAPVFSIAIKLLYIVV